MSTYFYANKRIAQFNSLMIQRPNELIDYYYAISQTGNDTNKNTTYCDLNGNNLL